MASWQRSRRGESTPWFFMVKWARRLEPPLSSSLSARQNGMSVSSWRRRRACSARAPTVHRSPPSSWPFRSGPRARSFSTSVGCFAPLRQDECRGPRLRGPPGSRTGPYAPRAPNRVRLPRVWRAEARAKDQDALTHADLQSDLTRTTALSVAGLDESCRHCRPKRKGLRNRLPRAPPNQVWGTDDAECLRPIAAWVGRKSLVSRPRPSGIYALVSGPADDFWDIPEGE